MEYNKESYLLVRPFLISGMLSENVFSFLDKFCAEEKREFDKLVLILQISYNHRTLPSILNQLINYFDKKLNVTKVIHIKKEKVLKIF